MVANEFMMPTKLIYGLGSLKKLKDEVSGRGLSRLLVVTDAGIVESGIVEQVRNVLFGTAELFIYDGVGHQATVSGLQPGIAACQKCGCDGVIPLGGGSSLVSGRAIALAATNPGPLTKYDGLNLVVNQPLPTLAIPTTAGSGSEVSPFIPLIDDQANRKFTIGGYRCCCTVAVLDGMLLADLPPGQAALSGVDALTHAMEAYLTTMATPVTDALALAAVRVLSAKLRQVVNTTDLQARQDCLLASTMANIACGNARLGLVHTLARSINSLMPSVPYGKTIGVLLVPVMEFNLPGSLDRFGSLADAFGYPGQEGMSARERASCLIKGLKELLADVRFPRRFEPSEVRDEVLPKLTGLTMEGLYGGVQQAGGRPAFVPGVNLQRATYDDVMQIYKSALKGWEI